MSAMILLLLSCSKKTFFVLALALWLDSKLKWLPVLRDYWHSYSSPLPLLFSKMTQFPGWNTQFSNFQYISGIHVQTPTRRRHPATRRLSYPHRWPPLQRFAGVRITVRLSLAFGWLLVGKIDGDGNDQYYYYYSWSNSMQTHAAQPCNAQSTFLRIYYTELLSLSTFSRRSNTFLWEWMEKHFIYIYSKGRGDHGK